jgi:collagenase-like PrtC family protease
MRALTLPKGMKPDELRLQRAVENLNERKVRYLIVAGCAVIKYTEPRYTKDLDAGVDATPRNARAVSGALREFGARSGLSPASGFDTLPKIAR